MVAAYKWSESVGRYGLGGQESVLRDAEENLSEEKISLRNKTFYLLDGIKNKIYFLFVI